MSGGDYDDLLPPERDELDDDFENEGPPEDATRVSLELPDFIAEAEAEPAPPPRRSVRVVRKPPPADSPERCDSLLSVGRAPNEDLWSAGSVIGNRYLLIEALGSGGMGDVVLADDLFLRRKVAIKTLREGLADDPIQLQAFRQEVALAHEVSHPGLARTFDLGEAGGVPFLTMEYLEGQSLWHRIYHEGPLPVDELRTIGLQVAAAVNAAHEAGVVHRDLKPSNIQLVPERGAVVMDFGLAAGFESKHGAPSGEARSDLIQPSTSSAGTPDYMAPEVWRAEPQGPATDIYAFGAILYEALAGEPPFPRENMQAKCFAHLEDDPPSLRAKRAEVPAALDRLVSACLAKRPEDRPSSMRDVARRLMKRNPLRHLATIGMALLAASVVMGGGLLVWTTASALLVREIRPAAQRLAQIAALRLDIEDLHRVREPKDIDTAPFQNQWTVLKEIKKENPEVRFIYTLRATDPPAMWEFVVDADPKDEDRDGDGEIQDSETGSPPGMAYDAGDFPKLEAVFTEKAPQADEQFASDMWGLMLSGYSPIRPRPGKEAPSDEFYLVGVDIGNAPVLRMRNALLGIFASLSLAAGIFVVVLRRRRHEVLPGFGRAGARPS